MVGTKESMTDTVTLVCVMVGSACLGCPDAAARLVPEVLSTILP